MTTIGKATRNVGIARWEAGAFSSRGDTIVTEEPLEIRVAGDTFAVTMRTPGHDRELVLGLLFAEGVLRSVDCVGTIAHCGKTGDLGRENTIDVTPAPGAKLALPEELPGRRGTLTTSACGVCGRRTIEDLLARCAPLALGATLPATAITHAVASLKDAQELFTQTGGCHGARLTTFDGAHVAAFEDVGRHNAVDKVVGAMLLQKKLPLAGHILTVSGRASFELVQKAALAGIPVLASVSAPSTLAVDLAMRANVTLAGFVRGSAMNVYAAVERVT
jgi:FdhD protein